MKIRGVPSWMADTCDPSTQKAGPGPKLKGLASGPAVRVAATKPAVLIARPTRRKKRSDFSKGESELFEIVL